MTPTPPQYIHTDNIVKLRDGLQKFMVEEKYKLQTQSRKDHLAMLGLSFSAEELGVTVQPGPSR
jgi:hypothetical protein